RGEGGAGGLARGAGGPDRRRGGGGGGGGARGGGRGGPPPGGPRPADSAEIRQRAAGDHDDRALVEPLGPRVERAGRQRRQKTARAVQRRGRDFDQRRDHPLDQRLGRRRPAPAPPPPPPPPARPPPPP